MVGCFAAGLGLPVLEFLMTAGIDQAGLALQVIQPRTASIRQPGEVWRRVDDLRGQMTPEVVHSSPDLPRPGQTS